MANGYDLANNFWESTHNSGITGVEAINSWPREPDHVDPYKPCFQYPRVEFTGTRMNANCSACGWEFSCKHTGPRPVIISLDDMRISVEAALRMTHVRKRGRGAVRLCCATAPGRKHHAPYKLYADLAGLMYHIRRHHPRSDFVEE